MTATLVGLSAGRDLVMRQSVSESRCGFPGFMQIMARAVHPSVLRLCDQSLWAYKRSLVFSACSLDVLAFYPLFWGA